MNAVNYHGESIDFDAAVNLMDDDIREDLALKEWSSAQEFFDAYVEAHFDEFGEDFLISEETGLICM